MAVPTMLHLDHGYAAQKRRAPPPTKNFEAVEHTEGLEGLGHRGIARGALGAEKSREN